MEMENRNPKQIIFNQIKGVISELNDGDEFCSVTITCGHENVRPVNLVTKKPEMDKVIQKHNIGDKVTCSFYLVSNKKRDRWYTAAILLSINNE